MESKFVEIIVSGNRQSLEIAKLNEANVKEGEGGWYAIQFFREEVPAGTRFLILMNREIERQEVKK